MILLSIAFFGISSMFFRRTRAGKTGAKKVALGLTRGQLVSTVMMALWPFLFVAMEHIHNLVAPDADHTPDFFLVIVAYFAIAFPLYKIIDNRELQRTAVQGLNFCLENLNKLPQTYNLPKFEISTMVKRTKESPPWLHVGTCDTSRMLLANVGQNLLDAGHTAKGIIMYEAVDETIMPSVFTPHDNLTISATMNTDGKINKQVTASIADVFACNTDALCKMVAKPGLQMISFSAINCNSSTVCASPQEAKTAVEQITAGLLARFNAGGNPLALVALGCATALEGSIVKIAQAWQESGNVPPQFIDYVKSMTYPWVMVDKTIPPASDRVANLLTADGLANITNVSPTLFVNAEAFEYIAIEDKFPNRRPPLEKAGVLMTNRETVRKMLLLQDYAMLLNTAASVIGVLLKIPTVAECMKDERIVKLLHQLKDEILPVAPTLSIIDPKEYLDEFLTQRLPNPYVPINPIDMDVFPFASVLRERAKRGFSADSLEGIPLYAALWLRSHMAIDDRGLPLELHTSPSPACVAAVANLKLGEKTDISTILSNSDVFGLDLYSAGLGEKVDTLFREISTSKDAISEKFSDLYW